MYEIEELDLKDNSEEEQIRTRCIFEDIKERAINGGEISEHEKDFFALGVKYSLRNDGRLEDYRCCDNYRFKELYLNYFRDLSGNGNYQKVRKGEIYRASPKEALRDVRYLSQVARDWNIIIQNEKHSNELLKQIAKETRMELKRINRPKRPLLFQKEKEEYNLRCRQILLHTKFIYCTALMILELFDKDDLSLILNDCKIEITEYSIIHIINRHFSEFVKKDSTKSYHKEDIMPKYFSKVLKDIFNRIECSGVYKDENIENVNFQYKGQEYAVWNHKRCKQIRGIGNVDFYRLETFYPIEDSKTLEQLNEQYELKKIDEELFVYVKKINKKNNNGRRNKYAHDFVQEL